MARRRTDNQGIKPHAPSGLKLHMHTDVAAKLGGTPPPGTISTSELSSPGKTPLDDLVDDLDDAELIDRGAEAKLAADMSAADVFVETKRKKSSMSPTKRTLKYLRKQGCQLVAVTEHWNPYANIRQDLFGIIDVLAIKDDKVIAVQTTSTGVQARIQKMVDAEFKNPETKQTCLVLPALFCAGIKVYVHGWRKNSKGKWILREVELS